MTDEQEFATIFTGLMAMVPGCALNKEAVGLYREAAQRLGFKKCSIALKQLMAERGSRDGFPSISEMASRTEENHLDAEEVSIKISGAVSRFGNYQGIEARKYIGPIGWDIVVMQGGWESVCQALNYDNMTTFQAQWRALARVMIQRKITARMEQIGYLTPMKEILDSALSKLLVPTQEP